MKTEHRSKQNENPRLFWTLLAMAAVIPGLSACLVGVREPLHEVDGRYPRREMYSNEPAPPPRVELVVGLAPSPSHIWVGGYWTRHSNSWFWLGGRWAARPYPRATWVEGRWDQHPRGHVRVNGHWQ